MLRLLLLMAVHIAIIRCRPVKDVYIILLGDANEYRLRDLLEEYERTQNDEEIAEPLTPNQQQPSSWDLSDYIDTLFKMYDSDGDSELSKDELKLVATDEFQVADDERFQKMVEKYDYEKSGTLNEEEFSYLVYDWYKGDSPLTFVGYKTDKEISESRRKARNL